MGTQTSRLIMFFTDNMSAGIKKAEHSLHGLEHTIKHFKHTTAGEVAGALGLGLSVEKAVDYGKEAVESYAEQQQLMDRIRNTANATPEEMDQAHHVMADLSSKYATDIGKIELALFQMTNAGMKLPEALAKLEPVVRAAKAGYGDVDKLSAIMPRAERNFHLTGKAVDEFQGSLVKASEVAGGGKDIFNQLSEAAVAAGPLVEKWGWTGVEGAQKWLSHVAFLTKELGSAEKGGTVMTEIVNSIGGTKTKAKFAQAFGKGFDIYAQTKAAQRRGLDPINYYIDMAIEAQRRGVKVFQSPELNEAIEAYIRRGGKVADLYKTIREGATNAIPASLAAQVKTAAFQIAQLVAELVRLKNELGKELVDAGVIDSLHRLMPVLKWIGEQLAQAAKDFADFFESIRDDYKGFMAIFDEGLSPLERAQRFNKFLTEFKSLSNRPGKAKAGEHGEPGEHGAPAEHGEPGEHGAPAEHGEPKKPFYVIQGPADTGPLPPPSEFEERRHRRMRMPAPAFKKPMMWPGSEGDPVKALEDYLREKQPIQAPKVDVQGFSDAGDASGAAFYEAFDRQLAAAEAATKARAERMKAMLEFSAAATIEPPREAGGSRAGAAATAKSRQRGGFYDINSVPIE